MTITQHSQQNSLDHEALTMMPVILGGPSTRRSGERRWPRLRRPVDVRDAVVESAVRERLSTPR